MLCVPTYVGLPSFLSHPEQRSDLIWVCYITGERDEEQLGEKQIGLLKGIKRMWILQTVNDSIRKPTHKLPRTSCLQISQLAHGHPLHTICLTHTLCNPMVHFLCVLPIAMTVSLYSQPSSEHIRKLAWLQNQEKPHKPEHSVPLQGKQKGSHQHSQWLCKIKRQ